MKRSIGFFVLVILFGWAAVSSAAYKVIIKKNQKVFEGELVREDDATIMIKSEGDVLTFKKSLLDLDRMKEVNVSAPQTAPATAPEMKPEDMTLPEIAKRTRESQKGKAKTFSDLDRANAWRMHESDPEVEGMLREIDARKDKIATLEQDKTAEAKEKIAKLRAEIDKLNHDLEKWGSKEENRDSEENPEGGPSAAQNKDLMYWQSQLDALTAQLLALQNQKSMAQPDEDTSSLEEQIESLRAARNEAAQHITDLAPPQ